MGKQTKKTRSAANKPGLSGQGAVDQKLVGEILLELANIAFVDPADIYNSDGTVKDLHQIPIQARKAISKIETKELYRPDGTHVGATYSVRLEPKIKALELLGKHAQLFQDTIKINGGDPIQVEHSVNEIDLDERISQIVESSLNDVLC